MSDLTVIYNDTCPICAREVAGYRRTSRREGLNIAFAGLSDGDVAQFGLTPETAAREFHVMEDGVLLSGVEAFAALWARLPRLRWLSRVVQWPLIAPLARLVYRSLLAPLLYAMHRRRVRKGTVCKIA